MIEYLLIINVNKLNFNKYIFLYQHILCSSIKSVYYAHHTKSTMMHRVDASVGCSKSRSISVRMLPMTAMGLTRFCTDPFLHVWVCIHVCVLYMCRCDNTCTAVSVNCVCLTSPNMFSSVLQCVRTHPCACSGTKKSNVPSSPLRTVFSSRREYCWWSVCAYSMAWENENKLGSVVNVWRCSPGGGRWRP